MYYKYIIMSEKKHIFIILTIIYNILFIKSYANPEDGVVSAGEAIITTKHNYTEINQYTDRAVIDWRNFNIAPNESVNFKQPSNQSIALNRVNSNAASNINGQLTANGKLIIINQNGIMFGKEAKLDVNGLLATTSKISNEEFLQGIDKSKRLLFSETEIKDGYVINAGEIKAASGLVGLVAPNVLNSGIIVAKAGKVALASGDQFTLDLYGDRLLDIAVSEQVKSQIVMNSGQVIADGGEILITASAGKEIVNSLVFNQGILSAKSISKKNGEIIINAEGSNAVKGNIASNKGKKQGHSKLFVKGIVDLSGMNSGESGGKLQIIADEIRLLAGTFINASGFCGESGLTKGVEKSVKRVGSAGGEILIGGDYLGQGDMPTAMNLYVDPQVMILNDAIEYGDAGRNIFWSDGATQFYGEIYSRALGGNGLNSDLKNANVILGGNLGDGGFVETSGKIKLDARGTVNLTASNGNIGTYLLDPSTVNIYGNFDPKFESSNTSIQNNPPEKFKLSDSLRAWIDFSDQSKVLLKYQDLTGNNIVLAAAQDPGSNQITLNNTDNLFVGSRIMLGTNQDFILKSASVTEPEAGTNNSDLYTINSIDKNTNTITLTPDLKRNYFAGTNVNQGYIEKIEGKSIYNNSNVNATVTPGYNPPLWVVSSDLNNLGVGRYFLSDQSLNITTETSSMEYIQNQDNFTYLLGVDGGNDAALTIGTNLFTFFPPGYNALPEDGSGAGGPNTGGDAIITSNGLELNFSYYMQNLLIMRSNGNEQYFGQKTANFAEQDPKIFSIYYDYMDKQNAGIYLNGSLTTADLEYISTVDPPFKFSQLQIENHNLGRSPSNSGYFLGNIYEAIEYNQALPDYIRNLLEQYQAVKWNIAIAQPEINYATTADGVSSLTTAYLHKLSNSSDLTIVADNINLDLQEDNLHLEPGRNLFLNAKNDFRVLSAGSITTNAGNIDIQINQCDPDLRKLDLANLNLIASGSGNVNITADASNVDLIVGNITADTGVISVSATAVGSNIVLPVGKSLITNGSANSIILSAGDSIINNNYVNSRDLNYGDNIPDLSNYYINFIKDNSFKSVEANTLDLSTDYFVQSSIGNYSIIIKALGVQNQQSQIITNNAQYNFKNGYKVNNFFRVLPKEISISLSGINKAYDGNNIANLVGAQYEFVGKVGTDQITLDNPPVEGRYDSINVGSRTVTINGLNLGSGGSSGNYKLVNSNSIIAAGSITPANLNVIADLNQHKVYGDPDPTKFNYQVSGLVQGDLQENVITGTLYRDLGEDVGNYAIKGDNLRATNYTISYTGADFTINPKPIAVNINSTNKIYGDPDPILNVSCNDLIAGDPLSIIQINLSRDPGEDAGIYPIRIIDASAGNNYLTNVFVPSGSFEINKAPLTVQANNFIKIQGQDNPVFNANFNGFKNSENSRIENLIDRISFTTNADKNSQAGSYPIIVTGPSSIANYDITYLPGILIVNLENQHIPERVINTFTFRLNENDPKIINSSNNKLYNNNSIGITIASPELNSLMGFNNDAPKKLKNFYGIK